jgi:hypothetical protein
MKHLFKFGLIVSAIALLASCSGGIGKAKTFVEEFANAIKNNDTTAIIQMYPDAVKADSLALAFNADSVSIEELETEGMFKVRCCGKEEMIIATNPDNEQLFIKESRGVFVWPKEKFDFALKTGWYNGDLTDVENAQRLSDTVFVDFLGSQLAAEIKKNLTVKDKGYLKSNDWITNTAVVYNNNDFDLPDGVYEVENHQSVMNWHLQKIVDHGYSEKVRGKKTPSHGSCKYSFPETNYETFCRYTVKVIMPNEQLAYLFYKPTGTDYEDYLKKKQ